MVISSKTLSGLPVQTRSGMALGKVAGFELDTETGRLSSLSVKTRGLVAGLLDQELSVVWDQIVEITDEQVTVKDTAVPAGGRAMAMSAAGTPTAALLSEHEGATEA
jgi:sporulation protein YlmC with PRC-barrel domain